MCVYVGGHMMRVCVCAGGHVMHVCICRGSRDACVYMQGVT